MNQGNDSGIRKGMRIPLIEKGGRRGLWDRMLANTVLRVCNAFLNLQVIIDPKATTSSLEIADLNSILRLPGTVINGGGGTTSGDSRVFRGAGAPGAATLSAGNYLSGDHPDLYIDTNAPVLYYCSQAGTEITAVWTIILPSSGYRGEYSPLNKYLPGQIVRVSNTFNFKNIDIEAGVYGCLQQVEPTVDDPRGNQLPQFPEPVGQDIYGNTKCWELIALTPKPAGCDGSNYVHSRSAV